MNFRNWWIEIALVSALFAIFMIAGYLALIETKNDNWHDPRINEWKGRSH